MDKTLWLTFLGHPVGMNVQALQTLFTGLIMSKITYALPSFAGQLTADDRNFDASQ